MGFKKRLLVLFTLSLISLTSFAQNTRGFYLQDVGSWLGNTTKENEILNYAQGNGFNYILFYDLGDISWGNSTQKNQLGAFIKKARTSYGITQVGGVVEYAGYASANLIPYNNSRSSAAEKFDIIDLEFEFWVSSSISSSYCSKFLTPGGYSCNRAGAWAFAWKQIKAIDDLCTANSLMSEVYLGWPTKEEMVQIASRTDRILLSAYRPTDSDIYAFSVNRMKDIASIGGTNKVITLLSSESSFMGPWLATHPQTRPYQTIKSALTAETGSFKQNISLEGYHWFTYKYMPKTVIATASVTASGPLTFCPGGSVTLTANSGSQYLWSPGGQTTRAITVTTAGSYTVRVTSSTGANATSSPTVVSNGGTGAVPTVTASGPLSFCPGGSVTLTSSSASSYSWTTGATTQSITVTKSGTYKVTAINGQCTGTSAAIIVDAVSGPPTPVVTANSSLSVCPGTVLTLTSTPANGYLWSNGATTRSIVVSAPGNYTVKAYSGPTCFGTSAVKTVTLLTAPAKPTISVSGSTILSTNNPTVVLTSSVATSYLWSTGSAGRAITVNSQGSYRVQVSNASGCTAYSNEVAVLANGCTPPPTPVISLSGPSVINSGQSVTLTANLSGGYLWSTGATTRSITVTTAGIYSVRSYNAGGCYSTSLPLSVTVMLTRIAAPSTEGISNDQQVQYNLYPNPMRDQLNIDFDQTESKNITIQLIDIAGRVVQRMEVSSAIGANHLQMNVSALSKGIYFALLSSDDQRQTVKLTVE